MSENQVCFVVLGNHLFPLSYFSKHKGCQFFMAEDDGLCTHFRYHKIKLIFFLTAMREFAQELANHNYSIFYHELQESKTYKDVAYEEKLKEFCRRKKIQTIRCFRPEDAFFYERLQSFCQKEQLELEILPSPLFLNDIDDFEDEAKRKNGPFMKSYYEKRRKRDGVLLDSKGAPLGGKWSFDSENRKKLPDSVHIPGVNIPSMKTIASFEKVKKLVEQRFSHHPGETESFWPPVTHKQANAWLKTFLEERLDQFGPYEDALSNRDPFLFHSALSPLMNIGLLPAEKVLGAVLEYYEKNSKCVSLASVEGLVRQIMGWREFMRGVYHFFGERQYNSNFFGHTRKLTESWYSGETGIPPLDDAIKKVQKYAYNHHIERLMVLGNCMLLSEIHPHEAYRWFMEMYVDSSDWVMVPNVMGMGIFSDGGIFATKPYCASSNYIRKMGHYPKGDWQDTLDGLYWRFIDRNKNYFASNPRTPFTVKTLEKMKAEKKERLFKAAQAFLKKQTRAS